MVFSQTRLQREDVHLYGDAHIQLTHCRMWPPTAVIWKAQGLCQWLCWAAWSCCACRAGHTQQSGSMGSGGILSHGPRRHNTLVIKQWLHFAHEAAAGGHSHRECVSPAAPPPNNLLALSLHGVQGKGQEGESWQTLKCCLSAVNAIFPSLMSQRMSVTFDLFVSFPTIL